MPDIDSSLTTTTEILTMPRDIGDTIDHDFSLDTARTYVTAGHTYKSDMTTVTNTNIDAKTSCWYYGLEGNARQGSTAGNSGIATILVVLFIAICLNFKKCRNLFLHFIEELRNNKKRENAFDEHNGHESLLTALMIVQYIIYSGIILHGLVSSQTLSGSDDTFIRIISAIGVSAAYYAFSASAYYVTGFTFVDKQGAIKWLRAFNASQSIAGVVMMIPSLVMLFYPRASELMIHVACSIYLIARLTFIFKWFSIFFINFLSLLYFILYLCILEIIPMIYVYKIALYI